MRLRDQIRCLVPAPRLALKTEPFGIHIAAREQPLHAGNNRLERARTRVPNLVVNVRLEDEISVRRVVGRIDHVAARRRHVVVQAVRELLVEVRNHRILLGRIEVLRLVEQPLERHAIGANPVHELHRPPVVILLLGVGV